MKKPMLRAAAMLCATASVLGAAMAAPAVAAPAGDRYLYIPNMASSTESAVDLTPTTSASSPAE